MRRNDYTAVRELWSESEGVRLSPGDSAEGVAGFLARNPGLSFVAQDGDAVVATILCGHDGRRGYIYHLAVAPSHRRRGLATKLVRRCLKGLESAGIKRCQVFVVPENEAAKTFWQAVGGRLRTDLVMLSIEL